MTEETQARERTSLGWWSQARLSVTCGLIAVVIIALVFVLEAPFLFLLVFPATAVGLALGYWGRAEEGHELQARGGMLFNGLILGFVLLLLVSSASLIR
jgi:hypothetical protein